jgi:tRNA pseudouridine55 synthase
VPPMYSALKQNGQKLYELARAGVTVERKARRVTIYDISVLAYGQDEINLEVACSKGTYIRSLAEDIGHDLGCGGTVKALRRLQAGQFNLNNAYTIEQLSAMAEPELASCLLPVDLPLSALPAMQLSEEQATRINYGQTIAWPDSVSGEVRLYRDSVFLGLGEILLDGKLAPTRLFNLNNP